MIKALKNKFVVIGTSIISAIIIVFFVVSIVLEQAFVIELPYSIPIVLAFILIVLLLIASVVGNKSASRYRRKNKLWSGALPMEVKQRIWNLVTPWLLSSVVTVLIAVLDTLLWRM